MRIVRMSPRSSVTEWLSGSRQRGSGSGHVVTGRPEGGGGRGGRGGVGRARRPADAGEKAAQLGRVGRGKLRERVAHHPCPRAVGGGRGAAGLSPAERRDGGGIDGGEVAQRPAERLLDVGFGIADEAVSYT